MILMSILRSVVNGLRIMPWIVVLAVAAGLAPTPVAAVPPRLQEGLRSSSVKVRVLSVTALARTKDKDATALLRPLLGDPEPAVRAAVVDALVALKDRDSIVSITRLKQDPDDTVRAVVHRALQALVVASVRLDVGDLSGQLSESHLRLLATTFADELSKAAPGVVVAKDDVSRGYGALLRIRHVKKTSDGTGESITASCELTIVELPARALRLSLTADATAGVDGTISTSMMTELISDTIGACAPSLAQDAAGYLVSRAKRPR